MQTHSPPRSISTNGTHYFIYFAFTFNSACEVTVAFPTEGDVNYDGKVNIYDVVMVTSIYHAKLGDPNWNPHADIAEPYGTINIYDVVTVTSNYKKTWTP